jgi:protein transport protein SEC20
MLTSKQLITTLEKADWLDRFIILSAFMFFILVVLFILKQRFIDRGLRIALWWTRFIPLPDFSSKQTNMLKVAEEGSASLSASVVAVTSSLSSVVASISPSLVAKPSSSISDDPSTPIQDPSSLSIATPTSKTISEPSTPVADPVHVEL